MFVNYCDGTSKNKNNYISVFQGYKENPIEKNGQKIWIRGVSIL